MNLNECNNYEQEDALHASANNVLYNPVHSDLGRKAWKAASRAAKYMSKNSRIVNPSLEKCIPRFEQCEMVLGELLGSGGFNHVYEVAEIELLANPEEAEHGKKISSPLQKEHRAFVARHVIRESSKNYRYALKFLSKDTVDDPERFCTGAADLVVEAKFLASLEHPNIIKLRGMAAAGTSGFASCHELGYFLVLDRLSCTLETRLDQWKEQENKAAAASGVRKLLQDRTGKKKREVLADHLHVAFQVASALRYLHENHIIYRDLKPDNIGFDIRGDVKLFDFGLAKELDASGTGYSEAYELSGNTGSLRYMAPEVALSQNYNLSADTYSFGLLVWQICSLELPYDGMSRQDHSDRVVDGQERPPLDPSWSTPMRILMKRSWETDPSKRPTMSSVYTILKREICSLRDGDDSSLETCKRRSTFVLNRDSIANPSNRNSHQQPSGHGASWMTQEPSTQRRSSLRNLMRRGSIRNSVHAPPERAASARALVGQVMERLPSSRAVAA